MVEQCLTMFCRETLEYDTFCRETLKHDTFCRKNLDRHIVQWEIEKREVKMKSTLLQIEKIYGLPLASNMGCFLQNQIPVVY